MKHPCCKFRFLIPVFILGFLAIFSFAVYELWNGVLANVLGVKTINYWQALGILVLSRILFGGFPCKRSGPPWRRGMMEHWQSLTPEEREKLREKLGHHCGGSPEQT